MVAITITLNSIKLCKKQALSSDEWFFNNSYWQGLPGIKQKMPRDHRGIFHVCGCEYYTPSDQPSR